MPQKALLGKTRGPQVDLHKGMHLDAGDEERKDIVNLHSCMVCPHGIAASRTLHQKSSS